MFARRVRLARAADAARGSAAGTTCASPAAPRATARTRDPPTCASRRARTSPSARNAAMNCVPLMSDSPSFASRRDRLEPDARERLEARQALAVDERLALADERQREMRERREVARRADRAAARHDGQHAAVEAVEQQLDRLDARAGVSLRERVRAQQHRRADDLVGVRLADAAGVRAQQPQLQLPRQLLGDRAVDEAAEAGVDAVGVLARAVRGALDELAGRPHLLARRVGQRAPARRRRRPPRRRRRSGRRR